MVQTAVLKLFHQNKSWTVGLAYMASSQLLIVPRECPRWSLTPSQHPVKASSQPILCSLQKVLSLSRIVHLVPFPGMLNPMITSAGTRLGGTGCASFILLRIRKARWL